MIDCSIELQTGYNFPYLNGGEVSGINNSGIETFRGNPIESLTKETIQNALDAISKTSTDPVKVTLKLTYLKRDLYPYRDDFTNMLISCKEYCRDNEKAQNIIDEALKVIDDETIPVLEIADYNTTGLKDAKQDRYGSFNSLVKSSGVSNKSDDAGGSFGIGKNATFTCSQLRSIIYSTLDEDNVLALQGVAKWATHLVNGRETQGTGYLGITKKDDNGDIKNKPFINDEIEYINDYFIRKEVGTSMFVMGFSADKDWITEAIKSTIESYFVAIVDNKLEVVIEGTEINKNTLPHIMETYFNDKDDLLTLSYYKAYLESNPIEYDFMGMGKVKLYLLADKDLPKRVAYVRSNGMKIINKGNFRTAQQFAGVLKFEGKEINKFIRSLENPSHDDIQWKRHTNPKDAKNAKKILDNLTKWIKKHIKDLENQNLNDVIDIDWLGRFLPRDSKTNDTEIIAEESIHKSIANVMVKKVETAPRSKKVVRDNNEISTKAPKQDNDEPKVPEHPPKTNNKVVPIKIKRSRVFSTSGGDKYIAIVESNNKCNSYLELRIIGEDGKSEQANISLANECNGTNNSIYVNKGVIGPIKFKKNETKKIEFELNSPIRYAMEVISIENNV